MLRIPLIEDLTSGPIPAGSMLLVEFTGASNWYNAALTITAGWLNQGGKVSYSALAQSPGDVRSSLARLGVNCEQSEEEGRLQIWDFYTASLGKRSKERHVYESLKVADLSLRFAREDMHQQLESEWLRVEENMSTLYRFNDEKATLELELTRDIPSFRMRKSTAIRAIMRGVHSDSVYEQLEGAHDGIIDFKLDDTRDPARSLIRIRNIRNVGFDGKWHELNVGEDFRVTVAVSIK